MTTYYINSSLKILSLCLAVLNITFVCRAFIFQPSFLDVPDKIIFITDFVWLVLIPVYKRVKLRPTHNVSVIGYKQEVDFPDKVKMFVGEPYREVLSYRIQELIYVSHSPVAKKKPNELVDVICYSVQDNIMIDKKSKV